MAKTVKQLLRKRKFTGQEVGQAYLITLAAQKKAQRAGVEFKPPFTRADLDRMEDSITTNEQYLPFKCYTTLYRSLVNTSNMTEANIQQFYNGYYRLVYTLKDCMQADNVLKTIEDYPLIMTQGQLDRIIKELTEERRSFNTSFYSIVSEYVKAAAVEPEQAPKRIRELVEATKAEICTNERILKAYREEFGEGYYTLPDGTRSDSMSLEEWQQLLQDRFLATYSYIINNKEAKPEETIKFHNTQKLLKVYELFYADNEELAAACKEKVIKWQSKDFTMADLKAALEEEIELKGSYKINKAAERAMHILTEEIEDGLEWHYIEPKETLSKYDVLTEFDLFAKYTGDDTEDDIEEKLRYEQLVEDYPALFTAAIKKVKKLLPRAAKLKEADYLQPIFTYGEVADSGLTMYDFFLKNFTDHDIIEYYTREEDTVEAMQKRRRIMFSRLAIIKEDSFTKRSIDESGNYIKSTLNPYCLLESIDSITDDEDRLEEVILFKEYFVEPALKFVYAYNELLDILAAVYDAESIKELKADPAYIETQIASFNNLLYMFYGSLCGTAEEKARKRKLIKQTFAPIKTDALKPTAKSVEKVTVKIKACFCTKEAIPLLNDFLPLINELTERGT